MAERKTTKEIVTDADGNPTGSIVWKFSDESTITFDMSKVPDAIKSRLALHGASQKVGDSYAGAAGSSDPLAYAKKAVEETIAQLYAGDWRATVAAGPRVNDLAVAISRATGEPLEGDGGTIELVAAMSDEDKKVWRGKTKIKLALAQIVNERNAAKIAALTKKAEEEDAKAKEAAPAPTA
jgi:hypothetical protein